MNRLPEPKIVAELYQSGMSENEIAEKFGVGQSCVHRKLVRAGCPRRALSASRKLAYRKGRRKPAGAMLRKGSDHWNWKDGTQRRSYRDKVEKEFCQMCGTAENLGIHHVNMDHYDDRPENLQVLCVSCHMRLHKEAYWKAKKAGKTPPKSNGPVGWTRSQG